MNPADLGKDAPTIYRDRRGRKLDMLTELIRQQEGKTFADSEKDMEWGKGLVQQQMKLDKKAEEEAEKNRPFARLPDDPELNQMLREQDRWGDPMAKFLNKNKDKEKKKKKEKKRKKKKKN